MPCGTCSIRGCAAGGVWLPAAPRRSKRAIKEQEGSGGRFMAASAMVFGLTLVTTDGDRTVRAKR